MGEIVEMNETEVNYDPNAFCLQRNGKALTVGELRQRLEKVESTLSICCQFGADALAINSIGVDDRDDPHMLCVANAYLQTKPDVWKSNSLTVGRMRDWLRKIKPTLRVYCHFGDKSDNTAMPIDAVRVDEAYSAVCLFNSLFQKGGEKIETYYDPSSEKDTEQ
jgi:hypothetical protein